VITQLLNVRWSEPREWHVCADRLVLLGWLSIKWFGILIFDEQWREEVNYWPGEKCWACRSGWRSVAGTASAETSGSCQSARGWWQGRARSWTRRWSRRCNRPWKFNYILFITIPCFLGNGANYTGEWSKEEWR